MKRIKRVLSALTVLSVLFATYALFEIEEPTNLHESLLFVYAACFCLVLLIYRISLMGRTSLKWTTLILTLLILLGLTIIFMNKTRYEELGYLTISGLILLIGDATIQVISKNKILHGIATISVLILVSLLLSILIIQPESIVLFDLTKLVLIVVSILVLMNFFLPSKKNHSR